MSSPMSLEKRRTSPMSLEKRRTSPMSLEKRRTLMKVFIEPQFSSCPLGWMLRSRKLNDKINRIHERKLRHVY